MKKPRNGTLPMLIQTPSPISQSCGSCCLYNLPQGTPKQCILLITEIGKVVINDKVYPN